MKTLTVFALAISLFLASCNTGSSTENASTNDATTEATTDATASANETPAATEEVKSVE